MPLDFLTLLYILLIGGGIVIILVIIRFLRNEVWVAMVDDGQAHIYAFLKKDDESGAAQIFMAGDTTEPPVGHVQFKENVGQILIKREGGSTSGKNQYKKASAMPKGICTVTARWTKRLNGSVIWRLLRIRPLPRCTVSGHGGTSGGPAGWMPIWAIRKIT